MGDVVEHSEGGRTYRVHGLDAKAAVLGNVLFELDAAIGTVIDAARTALDRWRGPHAVTFGDDVNEALTQMLSLRAGIWEAKSTLVNFPDAATSSTWMEDPAGVGVASVAVPEENDRVSAEPQKLKDYATAAGELSGRFAGWAAEVNHDGITAEVSWQRGLTDAERQNHIDQGVAPGLLAGETVTETETVTDVAALVPLTSPSAEAAPLQTALDATAELAHAVALAFESADGRLLDLLADYPGLAGFVVAGMGDGRVSGESSLAIVLAYFDEFDIAAEGGDPDDRISEDDLRAMAERGDLPAYVRDAAQYLIDNPVLFGLAETVNTEGAVLGENGDGRLSRDDLSTFLEFNDNLQVVAENFDHFDTADDGGSGDGRVSINDLEAVAAGTGSMAAAARWLLDHDTQRERLDQYEDAKDAGGEGTTFDDGVFSRDSLIGLAVDQQVYGDDPEAARQFVLDLPVAQDGGNGLPIWLCSDEGTKALANAALLDTGADLTDTQAVIAHLPETNGAVRNQLITAYYAELAQRADAVFAGELAGLPGEPGHPGANWLMYAPWASNGVHDAITADISVLGINPLPGQRQAAADGNQWIFDDIGGRFAAFVEMYEANPHPSEAELEAFFRDNFHDGDAHIRDGFVAYVGAMEETDPAQRQELMFQGNSLVAMHEQAGADPYLEEITQAGPIDLPDDQLMSRIDVNLGADSQGNPTVHLDLDQDLERMGLPNNHIDDAQILDLDPAGLAPSDYEASGATATQFTVGDDRTPGAVNLAPIDGIESWADEFPTSTETWWAEGGEVPHVTPTPVYPDITSVPSDPDGLEGTGANSWPDDNERMWTILRFFEQFHTSPHLYETGGAHLELDDVAWLDPATGLR